MSEAFRMIGKTNEEKESAYKRAILLSREDIDHHGGKKRW